MNRKVLMIAVASFVLSTVVGVGLLRFLIGFEVSSQLASRLQQESVAYRSVVNGLSQVAQTLYDETINKPQVTKLLKAIIETRGDERDIARGLLFREIYPSYLRLKDRGVRQLHFHSPDGLSVLRFHRPLKYGDTLFEVRESVRLANTELEPVEGFETGKLFHGFRFVFPLFHDGQHVGSVEISVPFKTIENNLRTLVPNELFEFVLNRDRVFSMLFPSERSIYQPFSLNNEFVIEDTGAKLGQPRVTSELQRVMESELLSERDLIMARMIKGDSFGLTRTISGQYYAALFIPVKSVAQEVDAYILTYLQVPDIENIYRNGLWIQLFFMALMASFATGYYRRQTAKLAIVAEREKLRAITERMAEGLFVQDNQGYITFLNEAAEHILGISADVAKGQIAHDLFHVHYGSNGLPVTIDQCPIRSVTKQGDVYESENEFFRRASDNELVPVQVTSAKFSVAGEEGGSLTIFRDITERKQYEDELKRARHDALESAHAKSEFLANMSHEIRTPMNGILGMLELLMHTDLSREQKDFLKIAQSSGKTLLSLLNSILDLSKYEAGCVELERIDFGLLSTLEETVKLFAPQAQGKGLEIAALIDPGVPEFVSGDPTRLRQVITNLLGNAIKFTDSGEVILSAELKQDEREALRLHVSIRDTGIGIAPEAQHRIFESFSQADGSTTRKYGGTGLGLTLSREIVTQMGGELWLESEPGAGSTFHFTVELQQPMDPNNCFIPNEDLHGVNALVVDDNATNRLILERYCDSWGMTHQSAMDGTDALQRMELAYAQGRPFDLVLTDMMMPQMDGITLAGKIRDEPRFAGCKLILITSYTGRALHQQAEKAGFECLLAKPLGRDELHDAIERVLFTVSAEPEFGSIDHSVSKPSLDGLRVLVAEDNDVNRLVALASLERLGCEAISVENGKEALDYLEHNRVDIVLMDCQMPVMDGLSATRALREMERQHGWPALPVIAMTAFVTSAEIQHCLDAGMDAHLGKPFEQEELKEILIEHCVAHPLVEETFTGEQALPESSGNRQPVLSLQILNELDELLDGDVEAILEIFMAQLPELVQTINTSIESGIQESTYRAAHTLKSSAANVGGLLLSNLAAELERQLGTLEPAQLADMAQNITQASEALGQALDDYIAART